MTSKAPAATTSMVMMVHNLPRNTSDDTLRSELEKYISVDAVYVELNYKARMILTTAYLITSNNHAYELSSLENISIKGNELSFTFTFKGETADMIHKLINKKSAYKPPVHEWPNEIFPGHQDYVNQVSAMSEDLFDLVPPDRKRSSAHSLPDDVFFLVLRRFKAVDLIRIERTCRKWQWMIRLLLGGFKIVNFADPTSIWGGHEKITDDLFQTRLLQRMFAINETTLEHLIIYDMQQIDFLNLQTIMRQCSPNLIHVFYITISKNCLSKSMEFCTYFVNSDANQGTILRHENITGALVINYPYSTSYAGCYLVPTSFYRHINPKAKKCVCTDFIDKAINRYKSLLSTELYQR